MAASLSPQTQLRFFSMGWQEASSIVAGPVASDSGVWHAVYAYSLTEEGVDMEPWVSTKSYSDDVVRMLQPPPGCGPLAGYGGGGTNP